jgi:DNA-binding response OmpR family regulator
VGDLVITHPADAAPRSGQPISLNPFQSTPLAALAERFEDLVPRDEPVERVRGPGRLGDHRIGDEHIERLRRQLTAGAGGGAVIAAVGHGSRFVQP